MCMHLLVYVDISVKMYTVLDRYYFGWKKKKNIKKNKNGILLFSQALRASLHKEKSSHE